MFYNEDYFNEDFDKISEQKKSKSQNISLKRVFHELDKIEENDNLKIKVSYENSLIWYFAFYGKNTKLKNAEFLGKIYFDDDFPNKQPDVLFLTPNIYKDINNKYNLLEEWNIGCNVNSIFKHIYNIIFEQNIDSEQNIMLSNISEAYNKSNNYDILKELNKKIE